MRSALHLLLAIVVLLGAMMHAEAAGMRVVGDHAYASNPIAADEDTYEGRIVSAHSTHCIPGVLALGPVVAASLVPQGITFVRDEERRLGRDPTTTHRPPISTTV